MADQVRNVIHMASCTGGAGAPLVVGLTAAVEAYDSSIFRATKAGRVDGIDSVVDDPSSMSATSIEKADVVSVALRLRVTVGSTRDVPIAGAR